MKVLVDVRGKGEVSKVLQNGRSILRTSAGERNERSPAPRAKQQYAGFYDHPDKNSAMDQPRLLHAVLARTFADLTYGAGYAERLPQTVDTKARHTFRRCSFR